MFDLLWKICAFVGAFSLVFSVGFVALALRKARRHSDGRDAREDDFHA